ncbi:MAG TPA: hypothetical protein VN048_13115 [Verrucomicrobiae bacterium]|jgi:hypothetical protein|nr:hypothetical protein [Verrucomicrobiae bacterium]
MKILIRTPRKRWQGNGLEGLRKIVPIPLRPPGYFETCYTEEEIQRENRLAGTSMVKKPDDLE